MSDDPEENGAEKNERQEWEKGQNKADKNPRKRPTGRFDGKKSNGAWGELPDYILKHGRGSMPTVPEKYRKYLEALMKQNHQKNK